jgi:hypothetical protein
MTATYTQPQLIAQLGAIYRDILATAQNADEPRFFTGTPDAWSAADYLKHLILSVKPVARVMSFPPDQVVKRFGAADRPSWTYDELVARYQAVLDAGARAEDAPRIMPVSLDIPQDTDDVRAHLLHVWSEYNNNLLAALATWSEDDLDGCFVPHPALTMVTARELLYFTLHHNTRHHADMQAALG